jgi:1-acyl-sn-glycerol-3-phosphate acyltransferase
MRPPPAIVRRAVLDPIWVPLAVGLALLFAAVAAAATLVAPLSRHRRLPRLSLFGAVYLVVNASLVLCCAGCWLRYPISRRRDPAYWSRLHQALLGRALALLVAAARPLLGFRVELQEPPGHDLIAGRPLLLLARHGGPGDSFALVQLLLSRYRRRPAIVLKETLRWDPGLDVLLGRLPSCFIRRGEGKAPERLAELARTMRADDAILLFPEGGNWTPGRHGRAIARLLHAGRRQAAADAAENRNVLPPQPTGMLACMSGRPDLIVAVVAHTGLEDLVTPALVWRALPVSASPMIVRWWFQSARSLPVTEDGRREWLRLQWALVDSWIDARKAAKAAPALLADAAAVVPEAPLASTAADEL